jgi:hypothetical protein
MIPQAGWASAPSLGLFLDLLDPDTFPSSADRVTVEDAVPMALPLAPHFGASELLEALFLEEPQPVAIFDVPAPELVAVRLLTALWPSLRKRFALSTFALSPRKIDGRSFDLVFAPKDARPKFTDWPGRRIDGRAGQSARHRWTDAIVDRVFSEPAPRLLDDRELSLIGTEDADTASVLRIVLLWDELVEKLDRSPSAALGLLDIVSTRTSPDAETIVRLAPLLARAAHQVVSSLPLSEAWGFLGAMARKMHGLPMGGGMRSVGAAVARLAKRDVPGAIALVEQPDSQGAIETIVPAVADGLARSFDDATGRALASAQPDTLTRLLASSELLAERAAANSSVIDRLAEVVGSLSPAPFDMVRRSLLPFLVEERHLGAAAPIIALIDAQELLAEVRHLHAANGLEAVAFAEPVAARAQELAIVDRLRNVLLSMPSSDRRDRYLAATLTASAADVAWLLWEDQLDSETRAHLPVDILRAADADRLRTMFADGSTAERCLAQLPQDATDVLRRIVFEVDLPLALHAATVLRLLPAAEGRPKVDLAVRALERCLRDRFGGDEIATITMLLGVVGQALNGGWAARCGAERVVAAPIASRNLVAFQQAPAAARLRIVGAVEDIAHVIEGRYVMDLDERAMGACARIFCDADGVDPKALLRASGRLLPLLLRAKHEPVSAMVAATFPTVYQELTKGDDVPDLLKFIPFLDWDRCKAARRELVDAFLSSSAWAPGDLALTACRSAEVGKILRRTAKTYGGEAYLDRVAADLDRLPIDCREQAQRTISGIRDGGSTRYNRRD